RRGPPHAAVLRPRCGAGHRGRLCAGGVLSRRRDGRSSDGLPTLRARAQAEGRKGAAAVSAARPRVPPTRRPRAGGARQAARGERPVGGERLALPVRCGGAGGTARVTLDPYGAFVRLVPERAGQDPGGPLGGLTFAVK